MRKVAGVLVLALVVLAVTACNLFNDPKFVSYSVTHTVAAVSVEIAATDADGTVFPSETETNWSYEFEVKYKDFPFLAHIAVTNKDPAPANSVLVRVYQEDTLIESTEVAGGDTGVITTSISY